MPLPAVPATTTRHAPTQQPLTPAPETGYTDRPYQIPPRSTFPMKIRLKLMGVLRERTPEEMPDWPEGTTIRDVLSQIGVETSEVQICSVNGALARDLDRPLHDNDELQVLPPVGGG